MSKSVRQQFGENAAVFLFTTDFPGTHILTRVPLSHYLGLLTDKNSFSKHICFILKCNRKSIFSTLILIRPTLTTRAWSTAKRREAANW